MVLDTVHLIPEKVKEYRELRELSVKELAAAMGVSYHEAQRIERKGQVREIPGDMLWKVCKALSVAPRYIIVPEEFKVILAAVWDR